MSEEKVNNIYISGATGFIGKNLINFLSEKNLNCIGLNLRENISHVAFGTGDCIIHLAGKAHDVDRCGTVSWSVYADNGSQNA